MATRKKLKKGVWVFFVVILFLSIAIYSGINIYKDYQYKQTYEYKLLEIGYTKDEVNKLKEVFKNEELDIFLESEKNEDILNLIDEKYFLKKNFEKYLSYKEKNKKKELSEIVRNINLHLDKKYYEELQNTNQSLDTLMLVNKYYALPSDYEPTDLVTISTKYAWGTKGSKKTRQVTLDAFLEMWDQAMEDGYYLMINSAYRSYQDQEKVYNDRKNSRGEKYADSVAARPGSSEHQTGLSLDIFSKNNSNQSTFKDTPEAAWLKENAHKYGFVLRYPEDKVNITGYSYESWHYRYVGVDVATKCFEENITFDEYYAYYLEK